MAIEFTIRIEADPVAQPRTRSSTQFRRGKAFKRHFTPDNGVDVWKQRIRLALRQYCREPSEVWTGPVSIDIKTFAERPESHPKWWGNGPIPKITRPDRDNLEKAILDAVAGENIWKDDCQVWTGPSRKFYCAIGQKPGAIVTITLQSWEEALKEAAECCA